MSKELTLQILKEYYFQGDDYLCGEKNDYYWASYSNDYLCNMDMVLKLDCINLLIK